MTVLPSAANDRGGSLTQMRMAMLRGSKFVGAVFIAGMDGMRDEFQLFRDLHPQAPIVLVDSAGGATRALAVNFPDMAEGERQPFEYYRAFSERLRISLEEGRNAKMG